MNPNRRWLHDPMSPDERVAARAFVRSVFGEPPQIDPPNAKLVVDTSNPSKILVIAKSKHVATIHPDELKRAHAHLTRDLSRD